jgi:hypothetical protein
MEMMSSARSAAVNERPRCGKHVTPPILGICSRVLPQQTRRQASRPNVRMRVSPKSIPLFGEQSLEPRDASLGQRCTSIFLAFAISYDDLSAIQIDVLHAKRQAFEKP